MSQLKYGLIFSIFQLLREVITYYQISTTQLLLLGLYRIVAFEMAYKEVGVECSLTLFRHCYHIKQLERFFYLCSRSLTKEFLVKVMGHSGDWR